MGSWDKGVEYSALYHMLLRDILDASLSTKARCYSSILLIQLRNGLRVSEAVEAYKKHLVTGARELTVRVKKKKRGEERLVVIPSEVLKCMDLYHVDDHRLRERVRNYLYERYGLNTHSLRYAFITHLLRNGVSPVIVAKITKHSTLDHILRYTQEKIARDILRSL